MLAYGICRIEAIHVRTLFSLIFYAKYCLRNLMDDGASSEMMADLLLVVNCGAS